MERADPPPDQTVRALVRAAARASLATLMAGGAAARPFASLVLVAADHDASPLLLLSDLADHTRNLRTDPCAALLFDGTAGWRDPLAGPRASLLGRIEACDDPRLAGRFLARHPGAAAYAGFADFRLYRMAVERAHLVAGFGRIHWLEATDVLYDTAGTGDLAAAEPDILAHMNADHGDAVRAIAEMAVSGRTVPAGPAAAPPEAAPAADWSMVGIDPEGADFRAESGYRRIDFAAPVQGPEDARRALVRLARAARDRPG